MNSGLNFDVLAYDKDTGNYQGKIEIETDYFIDMTISPESYDKELVFKLAENTFRKIRIMNESYKEK